MKIVLVIAVLFCTSLTPYNVRKCRAHIQKTFFLKGKKVHVITFKGRDLSEWTEYPTYYTDNLPKNKVRFQMDSCVIKVIQ